MSCFLNVYILEILIIQNVTPMAAPLLMGGRNVCCAVVHITMCLRVLRDALVSQALLQAKGLWLEQCSSVSQCNKGQARAQNFFSPISINLVPKVV